MTGLLSPWRTLEGGDKLAELLATWRVCDDWLVPAGVMAAWLERELDAMAALAQVPADAPVLTGRLAALAQPKTLIIAGLNAAQWVPTRPHPWLSERQLVRLGIPGNAAALMLAKEEWPLLWDGLGAEEIIATRSRHGFDGNEATPAAPWQELAIGGHTIEKSAPAGRLHTTGAASPAALPVPEMAALSPSMIEDALSCPYRAAVGRRGEVRPWEDFDALPDARALGLLLHDVIATYWANKMARDGTAGEGLLLEAERQDACRELQALAETAMAREDDALAALWRPRVAALIPELVGVWIDAGAQGWHVAGVETQLEGEVAGVRIRAKADLIEAGHGQLRVVDYKTGRVPTQVEIRHGGKPQLAVEGAVLGAAGKEIGALRFVRLRGYGDTAVELMDVDEPAAAVAAVPEGLSRLAARLRDPWTAVPDLGKGGLEPSGHCERCAFAGWCRFEERA